MRSRKASISFSVMPVRAAKTTSVGGVDDLGLVPGVGLELLADGGILHHEEAVGLESEGRGENEGLLEVFQVASGMILAASKVLVA